MGESTACHLSYYEAAFFETFPVAHPSCYHQNSEDNEMGTRMMMIYLRDY